MNNKMTTQIKSKSKLSLGIPTLNKHPSANNLLKNIEEKKLKKEDLPEKQEKILDYSPSSDKSSTKISNNPNNSNSTNNYNITINETDNPLIKSEDTFYIKNDSLNYKNIYINKSIPKSKTISSKNLHSNLFKFSEEDELLDKLITEHIKNGDNFEYISNKLDAYLKK